jgi:hypothetical protein
LPENVPDGSALLELESQLTVEKIREGFSFSVFRNLRDLLELTDAELARYLLIPIGRIDCGVYS